MHCDCPICQKGTEQTSNNDIENAVDRLLNDESLWSRYCNKCQTQVYNALVTYINVVASVAQNRQSFWQMMIALRAMLRTVSALSCKHHTKAT